MVRYSQSRSQSVYAQCVVHGLVEDLSDATIISASLEHLCFNPIDLSDYSCPLSLARQTTALSRKTACQEDRNLPRPHPPPGIGWAPLKVARPGWSSRDPGWSRVTAPLVGVSCSLIPTLSEIHLVSLLRPGQQVFGAYWMCSGTLLEKRRQRKMTSNTDLTLSFLSLSTDFISLSSFRSFSSLFARITHAAVGSTNTVLKLFVRTCIPCYQVVTIVFNSKPPQSKHIYYDHDISCFCFISSPT